MPIGQPIDMLDSPQLLVDLDIVDANLTRMLKACRERKVNLRVHFKSLKCAGLAKHIATFGVDGFLCAKLNEAEVLANAGITDIFIANQIVGPIKLKRLADLARRAEVRVCVDDPANIEQMGKAAQEAGSILHVLVEVDVGMSRCGVDSGEAALRLAKQIQETPGLRFTGLQGYDGHLQLMPDLAERKSKCLAGMEKLIAVRRLIEQSGIPVPVVTGAGTGTWEFVSSCAGITEIQPGSFILMDCAYHAAQPQFAVSLSIWSTIVSHRPGSYVLDAGSKAISRDFGTPAIMGQPLDKVRKLSEEHTIVDSPDPVRVGERRQVIPAHCCATMNLHRSCVAVRKGRIEAIWPIEASGRYD